MSKTRFDQIINKNIEAIEALKKLKINPFPIKTNKTHTSQQALKKDGLKVSVAGRIMSLRGHGKIRFADLVDENGKVQLVFKQDELSNKTFELLRFIDQGDFLEAQGETFTTKSGERSVLVNKYTLLTKAIRPLPSKWHGLKDVEERYRKRYLDMILNPEVTQRLKIRSKIITHMRKWLDDRGFLEVETPTLQPVYGGGFAKPFVTHHNALGSDFYLRISDEMYLKRFIVGGMEKVYEITKVFRNEGIDFDHNPEFTMFEAQIAFEDYEYGMELIEDLTEYVVKESIGKTKVRFHDHEIDFKRPWKRYRLVEAVKEYTGIDPLKWKSLPQAKKEMGKLKLSQEKMSELKKMHSIGEVMAFAFEEGVEEKLIQPTIIYDYPIEVSPLAKKCEDERFTQRFEQFAAGSELGNNYTELNDPIDLKKRFIEEKKREEAGFDEAHQTDYDYLTAMEHGFPPTCGVAIGVDRLVMMVAEAKSLKEIIAFPTLKPEKSTIRKTSKRVDGDLLSFDQSFVSAYPSASVGYAIIGGVTIKKKDENLEKEKVELLKQYENLTIKKIESYAELDSYRKMYQQMGVDLHSRKPSPEALLRRVSLGKGLYQVNTAVDAYNLIVMKNRVSLGAFDADQFEFPCSVKVAQGGEKIKLLGVSDVTTLEKGEVAYFDQKGPFNLDYNYRDADRTKVTEKTTRLFINVDGVFEVNENMVRKSLKESIEMITKYCGGKVTQAGIISAKDGVKPIKGLGGESK
jgi:lysyl-tRNA synthetase, class II